MGTVFTVVSAVYNVARYLDDFFDSLEAQSLGVENIEIILVDDGSTDDSMARCVKFADRHPATVRVVHRENGGQSAARNTGLAYASGSWVCFADPDDMLSETFFEKAHAFISLHSANPAQLYAARHLIFDEKTRSLNDTHSLRYRFSAGNRIVNLSTKPNYVQPHVNSALFDRARLVQTGVLFDERIHTRFEDGNFVARYLLHADEPRIGLIADAEYHYRVRADGSSAVQTNKTDSRTYTDIPRYGYLGVLTTARQLKGTIPLWAQNIVLYDLFWLIRSSQRAPLWSLILDDSVLDDFFDSLREILTYVSATAINAFDLIAVQNWMREALILIGNKGERAHGAVYIGWPDPNRKLVAIKYRYAGKPPLEELSVQGERVEPRYAKTIKLELLGRVLVSERIAWVSSRGIVRVSLNGELQEISSRESVRSEYKHRVADLLRHEKSAKYAGAPPRFRQIDQPIAEFFVDRAKHMMRNIAHALSFRNISELFLVLLLRNFLVRRLYSRAWVLMDRDTDANDSAEVLYRWIRKNKPATKIWFVVRRSSPDWKRLQHDHFKLINYGSLRWKLLMLLAAHMISSHADRYVTNPLPESQYGRPQWRFTFLQHGIIKGDISLWLNRKKIDLFVTSTEEEYDYVSGESVFKFGPKAVRLTGLPRHDDLLVQDLAVPSEEKTYILVMPTWRDYLTGDPIGNSNERSKNQNFASSSYAVALQDLLKSNRLRDLAMTHGLRIAFMPHPNVQPYLSEFVLPKHVEILRYADVDVRTVIAHAALMITDYSSIAFNIAYLQRPVVYYQFDLDEYYSGGHTERPGYFDYTTHGFGPVATTIDQLEQAVATIVEDGVPSVYMDRMQRTFPVRDGKNSERVYKAIKEMSRAVSFAEASRAAQLDRWTTV